MKKNVIKSILGFSAVLLFAGTVLSGCGKKDSKELKDLTNRSWKKSQNKPKKTA